MDKRFKWDLEFILGPIQNLKRKNQRGCRPDFVGLKRGWGKAHTFDKCFLGFELFVSFGIRVWPRTAQLIFFASFVLLELSERLRLWPPGAASASSSPWSRRRWLHKRYDLCFMS